jgi:DNA helicase-2/ATP-dependent DNA helicase PcrA
LQKGLIAAVPAQRQRPRHGLKVGTNVFFTPVCEGRVQCSKAVETMPRAQINFTRHGVKRLALSVAKLTIV